MSGCSCHVETIAPLVMMSNYQNEAEIRDHVFGKEPLRPPHAARSRARLNASRYDRRSAVAPTWAGKPMPRGTGFPARGFGTGRTLRPPSSAHRPPRRVNHGHEGWPLFSVAKPNLHLPTLDVYFYNSDTPTIAGKERGPWSLTVDFGDTCLFHDENSLSSRYSTVVWTTAKIRPRRRVHRDNESPKGRGNALSAAGLKTRQTPLGRS